jgi:hypothetical protein
LKLFDNTRSGSVIPSSDSTLSAGLESIEHMKRAVLYATIAGSVPVQSASGETKLLFRIEGKIDIAAIRSAASRKAALEAMRVLAWW